MTPIPFQSVAGMLSATPRLRGEPPARREAPRPDGRRASRTPRRPRRASPGVAVLAVFAEARCWANSSSTVPGTVSIVPPSATCSLVGQERADGGSGEGEEAHDHDGCGHAGRNLGCEDSFIDNLLTAAASRPAGHPARDRRRARDIPNLPNSLALRCRDAGRMGRPVRRVLSGGVSPVDGHLSRRHVAVPLQRPTRGLGEPRHHPLSGLAPGEVYLAGRVTATPVVSYTTLSPLPRPSRGGVSLGTVRGRSGLVLPTVLPCGARTFLGATANRARRDRPADPFAPPSLAAAPGRPLRLTPCRR